ncbi:MAG: type III pantothenate kinase [Planctomycetes bacterium]|nr:type III pantothenate kinase [Planctomycetota bacterium]
MNLVAIDIGNTNVTVGLFVGDSEKFIESVSGDDTDKLGALLVEAWEQIPLVTSADVDLRDGSIVVSSVKGEWTKKVREICKAKLDETIKVIGVDINLPIEMGVENPMDVGTDRVVAAAAAFAVVEDAVVVADFGTAVTIDLVDEEGVFMGGVIAPGFTISAKALSERTAKLPEIDVHTPKDAVGGNTEEAVNAGLLKTVVEKYAEEIGRWPHTIVTGGDFGIIKDECAFVDSWVSNLVVRGVVLAYKKHLAVQGEIAEFETEDAKLADKNKRR